MIPEALLRSPRLLPGLVAATCAGLLGFGYYLQFFAGQVPCPLCIFQRFAYLAVGFVALVAAVHGPAGRVRLVYDAGILLAAVTGAGIAARQVWLQHLPPDQVPECGPGLDYMLDVFPLTETLRMVFTGSGECAEVGWQFLSLSIAEWSLLWFLAFIVAALVDGRAALRGSAP
jgi:disulfide bond formation protein DsbB